MNSMTGFGRAEIKTSYGRVMIDVTSLNSRFLDFSFRAPRPWQPLELKAREMIGQTITRGKVSVSFLLDESSAIANAGGLNVGAIESYHQELQVIRRKLKIKNDLAISDLLSLPGVSDANGMMIPISDLDHLWGEIEPGLKKALKKLSAMRGREGKATIRDMRAILKGFTGHIRKIKVDSTRSIEYQRKKITDRINDMLQGNTVSSERIEEEIVIFAEKSDITEELCRLRNHVDEFDRTLKLDEPVGKRLNFTLQEMNREVNTIGSKCSEFAVTSSVIILKEEIEKLREMVQNAE